MNGCIQSGQQLLSERLDETVDALTPNVLALLQRVEPETTVAAESDDQGHRLVLPITFPDGIGHGSVVARVFRYREQVRVDIELVHDRMLARPDGRPSDRRAFLNDYVASIMIEPGARTLPAEFERHVLRGIDNARDAVQRHNRDQPAPWNQVRVTVRETSEARSGAD